MRTIRSLPLGARLPSSVHAVSCSLPTMADVIGYEERRPETMERIQSGYPRFVTHFLIRRIAAHWEEKFSWSGRDIFVVSSERAAAALVDFCRTSEAAVELDGGLAGVGLPAGSPASARAKAFVQHTGTGISSRQAEDFLYNRGLIEQREVEETVTGQPEAAIADHLRDLFGCGDSRQVALACSGMNAFYAAFQAVEAIQRPRGRDIWIQFGWLYVDTIEILRKFAPAPEKRVYRGDIFDLEGLEAFLRETGHRVAGLVTELPTNPKVQTPRAWRLRELADHYGFPLLIDPTLACPYNIQVLPLADVVINSLTKYAASAGDVMAGAAVVNPASRWAEELREGIGRLREPLYPRDAARLAFEMQSYREVVRQINANTLALVPFLESHPAVKKVLWAREEESAANYDGIAAGERGPGGIVTIELKIPLEQFYDALPVMKGPSFGTVFTLACPFMYLAHYDLVSSPEGRARLREEKLDPDLVRISVGTEPAADIIGAFQEALARR